MRHERHENEQKRESAIYDRRFTKEYNELKEGAALFNHKKHELYIKFVVDWDQLIQLYTTLDGKIILEEVTSGYDEIQGFNDILEIKRHEISSTRDMLKYFNRADHPVLDEIKTSCWDDLTESPVFEPFPMAFSYTMILPLFFNFNMVA
jgi:hypothetical protein